jgi:uncharacterized protein with PIN domain
LSLGDPIVLDAWAIMALLRGEPAGPTVARRISRCEAVASWVNAGEAYYVIARDDGREVARSALRSLQSAVRLEEPDAGLVLAAADLKATGGLSYADCFAVATARLHQAPLLTGDPEILDNPSGIEVIDLRGER